jgi:hypothetical protein
MSTNYIVAKYVNHTTKEIGITRRDIVADKNSIVTVVNNVMCLTHDKKSDDRVWTIDFMGLDRTSSNLIKDKLFATYADLGYTQVTFLVLS